MRKLGLSFTLVLGLSSFSLACVDLPEVEAGACGNKIVDDGEDCDGEASAPEGTVCRAAGGVGACRFDCAAGSQCPSGYVCGGDAICRAPSGGFTDLGTSVAIFPTHLVIEDFDGDRRSDVLAYTLFSGEARALFFEPSGAPAKSVSMQSDVMAPAAGKLAGGAAGAFTFATNAGLGVMRGQADRSFAPTPYTSLLLPWPDGHLVTMEAMPPGSSFDPSDPAGARWLGDEAVIFHGRYAYATEAPGVAPADPGQSTFRLPRDEAPVAPVRVANLDSTPGSPCEELVLSYGDDKVYVVTPCRTVGNDVVWNRIGGEGGEPAKTYPVISLVDAAKNPVTEVKIRTVFTAQLNAPTGSDPDPLSRDLHLDLVINTWDPTTRESRIFVAMGDGAGRFAGPAGPGDNVLDRAVEVSADPLLDERLLAVADIDLDGRPDFVFPSGIARSNKDGGTTTIGVPHNRRWTDAVVADFNGDGLPDVMCSASDSVGIDFFTNAGAGVLNPLVIPTEAPVSSFVVGDFDGDLTRDVAFRVGARPSEDEAMALDTVADAPTETPDSLGVIFGRFGQPPEAPQIIGELARMESIIAGRGLVTEYPADGISDLGVVSSSLSGGDARTIAVFQGRSDRLLQSPFNLTATGADPFSNRTILATAVGSFVDGTGEAHVDISALVLEESFGSDAGSDMSPRLRLWILPSTGSASLDIGTAKSFDLSGVSDANVDWWGAELTAVDVDGDGQDEVLITAPYNDIDGSIVSVSVARLDESGNIALAGPFPLTGEGYYAGIGFGGGEKGGAPAYFGTRPPACVTDVDGDGKKDLVTAGYDATAGGRATILFGTGDKSAPFAESRAHATAGEGDQVVGFTCVNLDRDGAGELVLLGYNGAHSVDFEGREPKAPVLLPDVPGGTAVASGDFDGDGIADLVVSTFSGLRIYRGAPVIQ